MSFFLSKVGYFIAKAGDYLPVLMQGVGWTIVTTILAVILSTVLGFVWALMIWSRIKALVAFARTFITVIRGIPILVQLYYIYFVMPDIGVDLSALQAGIIGLGIAYSAYQAENFRAGIEAIDKGQIEAALSIGMTDRMLMRRVILPQAVRLVMPPFGNTIIMILKDSSLVSTITVTELTRQGQLITSSTFENTTVYTLVALIYLSISLPLTFLTRYLERRFSKT